MKRAIFLTLVVVSLLGATGCYRSAAPDPTDVFEATPTVVLALPVETLELPTSEPPTQTPTVTASPESSPTPISTPTASPTLPIGITPSPAIANSFVDDGIWQSDELVAWVALNFDALKGVLEVIGIESPEELELAEVRVAKLAASTQMLALRGDGVVFQGGTVLAGTEVWCLIFRRPGGEEVLVLVNPACTNIIGKLPPQVTVTAFFTPLPSLTPGGPTLTPSPTSMWPTPTPTPPYLPTVTRTPPPTSTPGPTPSAQPPTSVPTATGHPAATPTPGSTNAPDTPTPVPATATPVPPVVNTPVPNRAVGVKEEKEGDG